MNLFIDDYKQPHWYTLAPVTVATTGEQALEIVAKLGEEPIDTLFLDHDLGEGINGHIFLTKLVEEMGIVPKQVRIISFNASGREKIRLLCQAHNIPLV